MEVDVAKLFGDEIEQVGFGKSVNLGLEVKAFEDITNGIGKVLDVGNEILTDMVRVAHELVQVEGRSVVEVLTSFSKDERLRVDPSGFPQGFLFKHSRFGRFKHTIEAPEHGERENDSPIFRLFIIAT
jgi:hypothetical protein